MQLMQLMESRQLRYERSFPEYSDMNTIYTKSIQIYRGIATNTLIHLHLSFWSCNRV